MSDENIAPGGEGDLAPITSVPVSDTSPISARDAANAVIDFRNKAAAKAREPLPSEINAMARRELAGGDEIETPRADALEARLADEANTDSPQETPGETTETTEPEVELPPIEPPRSWTKEEKEEFKSYPREAQEKIARREQDRESSLRKGQNETAEQRKALEAERVKMDQARQQYESALRDALHTLQTTQSGEFSDIKTTEDVEKLAAEDWPRFARYQAHLMKVGSLEREVQAAQERQTQEYKSKWAEFASKEDALFLDKAPEMADKGKATKVADASVALLKDIGFSEADLAKLWNGEASISLRDHRAQLLIRDAARYREAQKQVTAKVVKPVPPVQRPGVAPPKGQANDLRVQTLDQKLERSGNLRDAAALLIAKRQAAR